MNPHNPTALAAQLDLMQHRLQALAEENDLLLAHINRLYEEGEAGSLSPQGSELAQMHAFLERWWLASQPDEIVVDLCAPVWGSNWHETEATGRWSGPDPVSHLWLPPLRRGHYGVKLEVVDAMGPDILSGLRLRVDEQEIEVESIFDGQYPALVVGRFTVAANVGFAIHLELHCPRVMSPRERGEGDDRLLSLRVRSLTLTRFEPE